MNKDYINLTFIISILMISASICILLSDKVIPILRMDNDNSSEIISSLYQITSRIDNPSDKMEADKVINAAIDKILRARFISEYKEGMFKVCKGVSSLVLVIFGIFLISMAAMAKKKLANRDEENSKVNL